MELGGSLSLFRALTLSGSYAWYEFTVRENLVGNSLLANTPRNKGALAADYAGRRVSLSIDVRLVEGYPWMSTNWAGSIPSSQTVNAHAGYRFNPQLRGYLSATDLLDQRRFHVYGGSVIGRRVLAGMRLTR